MKTTFGHSNESELMNTTQYVVFIIPAERMEASFQPLLVMDHGSQTSYCYDWIHIQQVSSVLMYVSRGKTV
jgi:hypothetical protein